MKYFEDFVVDEIEPIGEYPLSREEIIAYSKRWAPQDFHFDPAAADRSVFAGLTAAGIHLVTITVRQLVLHQPGVAVLAGLGWDEVRFLAPARPGDTLTIFRQCIDRRFSESKTDRGIVKYRIMLDNQEGEPLLRYIDTQLVRRRPHQFSESDTVS